MQAALGTNTFYTGGPWRWSDNFGGGFMLATPDRGRLVVMDFVRMGMRGAQPRFAVRTRDDEGGRMLTATEWMERGAIELSGDARLIAAAPAMDVLLRLCSDGRGAFDPSTKEFRFNGLRFSTLHKDWSVLADVIGWNNLRTSREMNSYS